MFSYPVEIIKEGDQYGMRKHPIYGTYIEHQGTDFKAECKGIYGDKILSFMDGTVKLSRWQRNHKGFGKYIVIEHVLNGKKLCSLYTHLNSFNVKPGDTAKCGDVIGYMGTTGDSTGVHCHFGIFDCAFTEFYTKDSDPVRYWKYPVDPMIYLSLIGKEEPTDWKEDLIQWGLDEKLISEYHKPDEKIEMWTLMAILKNYDERKEL